MPSMDRERKLLQQSVAIVAAIPVATGLYGVLFGQALTGDAVSISAESHFRFLSGLLLGIGLCFWSTLPSIEVKTGRFRLLTLLVVIGGLGRLIGLGLTGVPSLLHDRRPVRRTLRRARAVPVADPGRQPLCRGIRGRGGLTSAWSLWNCPDKAGLSAYHVAE